MMRKTGQIGTIILALATVGAVALMLGCGNTSGNPNHDGSSYVDETAGAISLSVTEDLLPVSDITGFSVGVTDRNGSPVPNIEIACDTEKGLALIEPTTGYEMTDSSGHVSGKVGCETPGSYLLGCRLPVGGYKRQFVTVRCQGPIPAGFSGFPGAGGGGLGTGGSGGAVDVGEVRITSVTPYENNDETLNVDVTQGVCTDNSAEPFTDTFLKIKVTNSTAALVNFYAYEYTIRKADGASDQVDSDTIYLSDSGDIAASSSTTFTGLFLKAGSGHKRYVARGVDYDVPSDLGNRNVLITLYGTDGKGDKLVLQYTVGMTIGSYNNCS